MISAHLTQVGNISPESNDRQYSAVHLDKSETFKAKAKAPVTGLRSGSGCSIYVVASGETARKSHHPSVHSSSLEVNHTR